MRSLVTAQKELDLRTALERALSAESAQRRRAARPSWPARPASRDGKPIAIRGK